MSLVTIATDPVWTEFDLPQPPALDADVTADVCVVGAGIAGMTTAYMLARKGQKVVVVDDSGIGNGQTACTTAHLASAIDDRFSEMERLHGEDGARLAGESHAAAIDTIEHIVAEEAIECEFERVDGYLFAGTGHSFEVLEDEYNAAKRARMNVELIARAPLPSYETGKCLKFARQGQFHPIKYLKGLFGAIERHGGKICCSTRAMKIEGGSSAHVETQTGFTVRANAIVVATNTPINDLVAIHTKQAPYMSYVIGCAVPRGAVPRALYWDTLDPYHYVRLQSMSDADDMELLIVGGEDHKTGQAHDGEERFDRLERWARYRFPLASQGPSYRWSGQVMETIDGLAFIGRNPLDKDNVFVATGDSGMGMTHGTIAGILLTELILGNDHRWRELYDPSRKTLRAIGAFARENLNVAAEYGQWLTAGELASEDMIAPGSGAVIRQGLRKMAVYRDEHGALTRCSAACPHLKCVVAWNQVEQTWDCPCHGSRFDPQGHVLNGPANRDLKPIHAEG